MRALTGGGNAAGTPTRILAAAVMAIAPAPQAFACGYDSPQSVSRGALNWVYPDSLHVIGAISREVSARRLPLANFDRSGPDLFGRSFGATRTALNRFAEMLRAVSPTPSQAIALVLVEPMLWARFDARADGLQAQVHVSGAEPGDLVLVSGEAVIGEIAGGRLSIGEAATLGLMRLYGSERRKAEFIADYAEVGSDSAARASGAPVPAGSGGTPRYTAADPAIIPTTDDHQ